MSAPSASPPAIPDFNVSSYYSRLPPADTAPFIMQQTMVRVKNPKTSLDFYTNVLGFRLIMHRDFPQWGFSVYFLAYLVEGREKDLSGLSEQEQWQLCMRTPGCVELTWNHGSEKEEGRSRTGSERFNPLLCG